MTPLERAARALCEDMHAELGEQPWEKAGESTRDFYRKAARAALTAIREPSQATSIAIAKAIEATIPCDSGTDPAEAETIVEYGVPQAVVAAMIDAALAE